MHPCWSKIMRTWCPKWCKNHITRPPNCEHAPERPSNRARAPAFSVKRCPLHSSRSATSRTKIQRKHAQALSSLMGFARMLPGQLLPKRGASSRTFRVGFFSALDSNTCTHCKGKSDAWPTNTNICAQALEPPGPLSARIGPALSRASVHSGQWRKRAEAKWRWLKIENFNLLFSCPSSKLHAKICRQKWKEVDFHQSNQNVTNKGYEGPL